MIKQPEAQCVYFKRHQHLARGGEMQGAVYRLEDGWACGYRILSDGRRQISGLYLPGDYCEPQWVLDRHALQPVVALTPVRVRAIPLDTNVAPTPRAMVRAMLKATRRSIDRQAEWIVTLGRKTATERLSELLYTLFERIRANGKASANSCTMPLTQNDLADTTGLTPVHVNRVLKSLKTRGVIELRDRTLQIHDPDALRRAAALR